MNLRSVNGIVHKVASSPTAQNEAIIAEKHLTKKIKTSSDKKLILKLSEEILTPTSSNKVPTLTVALKLEFLVLSKTAFYQNLNYRK